MKITAKLRLSPVRARESGARWRTNSRGAARPIAISDVDEIGLAETAKHARVTGAKVFEQRLDVTDRAAVLAYADRVVQEFGSSTW